MCVCETICAESERHMRHTQLRDIEIPLPKPIQHPMWLNFSDLKGTGVPTLLRHTLLIRMCTLHQNIPFYVLIPFMFFKQCFMNFFMIFSSFEVWYISPLNTCKTKILLYSCIYGGNMSNFKWRKNHKNFHKSLFKAHIWKIEIKRK